MIPASGGCTEVLAQRRRELDGVDADPAAAEIVRLDRVRSRTQLGRKSSVSSPRRAVTETQVPGSWVLISRISSLDPVTAVPSKVSSTSLARKPALSAALSLKIRARRTHLPGGVATADLHAKPRAGGGVLIRDRTGRRGQKQGDGQQSRDEPVVPHDGAPLLRTEARL